MTEKGVFLGTGGGSVGRESDAVRWVKHWVEKEWQEEEVREQREGMVGELKRRRRDDTTAIKKTTNLR